MVQIGKTTCRALVPLLHLLILHQHHPLHPLLRILASRFPHCSLTLVFVQSLFQPSLSQFSHLHLLTTPSTSPCATSDPYPTSISIPASSLTHPSSKIQFLKHPIEISEHPVEIPEHPLEPLQTSCRSSRTRFLDSQTL